MDKGYDKDEANDMAINAFRMVQFHKFYHSVEYFIDKILSKAEYEREYGIV